MRIDEIKKAWDNLLMAKTTISFLYRGSITDEQLDTIVESMAKQRKERELKSRKEKESQKMRSKREKTYNGRFSKKRK
jgi:hypothetical protein